MKRLVTLISILAFAVGAGSAAGASPLKGGPQWVHGGWYHGATATHRTQSRRSRKAPSKRSLAGVNGWQVYSGYVACDLGSPSAFAYPANVSGTNTTSAIDWQWIKYRVYSLQRTTGSGWVRNLLGPDRHLRTAYSGYISEVPAYFSRNDWVFDNGMDANGFASFTRYADATEVWVVYEFEIYDLNTARWYTDWAYNRAC
jgi:hypothetical protein